MAKIKRKADKRFVSLLISVICAYISAICVIIGLCTNYWIEIKNRNLYREETIAHFGLQRVCWSNSDRCTNSGLDYDRTNTAPAAEGLLITGGFVLVVACCLALFNTYLHQLGRSNQILSAVIAAVLVLASVFLFVGIIIFGVKVEVRTEYLNVGNVQYMGYSFGLTTTAAILLLIGAGFHAITSCSQAQPKFNQNLFFQ
ncbi:uncharacterized protein LOC106067443 [Biomphalaria glabrata]|uniref:Uncharacterized protein LOC106067443 n=1 Tax=Biomphalaria glabrata TaxID=6526 RepID=A0A9W2YNM1_BIOGL|nr:uncharacterized protein LOC106067443 [Biomphalaria glabrata]